MDESLKNMSDKSLISLLQSGNHRFFSHFTTRYEKYILKKCKRYVKNDSAAQDLCQEVLIKVFLQLPSFRQDASITTWLYAIIHNTCVDYLRRNKKRIRDIYVENLADSVVEIVDFDEEIPEQVSIEVLEALLDEMTPEGKLILLLKYRENHSIQDIMHSLNLSESAVKMRLKRARELLNKIYSEKRNALPNSKKLT